MQMKKYPKKSSTRRIEDELWQGKRVPAFFYRTEAGGEPVREWLKSLATADKRAIGADVMAVEFGWPLGLPLCRPLQDGVHEVRTELENNRIARVLFYIDSRQRMVLLHGFIKKTRKTPQDDLALAIKNKRKHEKGLG
jgi:phage-related protein